MNPEFYKIIKFGGYDFWCPKSIGAGIRSKFNKVLLNAIASLPELEKLDPLMKALKKDNDMILEQEYKTLLNTSPETINELVDFTRVQTLSILNTLLTPCDGSPGVEEVYDYSASDEEVKALVNFFNRNVPVKTKDGHSNSSGGGGSARRKRSR